MTSSTPSSERRWPTRTTPSGQCGLPWPSSAPSGATPRRSRLPTPSSLAVRIAINTGPVVIRPESEDPYNAVGDTVNVASRIQKLVDGGEIVVGPSTKAQIQELFELAEMGEQDLRGVSEPIETFRVLGVREEPAERWRTPLVGRDFELSLLDRAMDGLAEGRGTIVAIAGEPGIGKSRLAAEVRARYADRVRFLEGRAVSYAAAFPYGPIRDLLHDWLGVSVSMPEARTRLELKAQLGRLFGEDADAAYPFLASLLGLTLEPEASDRIGELSRESLRHETFDFFDELVCRLADEQSLCLVFEDLHWADDASLELLESLLHVTEESAVGLVFLYRTEREHGSWRLGERARQRHPHRYRDVELRPLPDDASRVLAVNAAGAELPESVVELLTVRAGGNPFFLEAALHDLLERGILTRRNGNVDLAVDPDRLTVPTLVQGALQARLDRLDARRPGGDQRRRGDRSGVRAAAARGGRRARPSDTGALRAPAARSDRRDAPAPVHRVQLPARPRPGGRLLGPARGEAAEAPRPGRRGARGSQSGAPRGSIRAARPPLRRGRSAREGRPLPAQGR